MASKSSKSDVFVIYGKAFWANMAEPNKLSGKYQLDLYIDEKTAELLTAKGIEVRTNDKEGGETGQYVTPKSNYAPKLKDGKNREITTKLKIGNGSEVAVLANTYSWTFRKTSGVSLGLISVQVRKLVEYKGSVDFDEVEGFEAESSDSGDFPVVEESSNPF